MKPLPRIAIFGSLLVAINVATVAVVSRNQTLGLYPVDTDSIGIPIMETLWLTLVAMPYLVLVAYCCRIPSWLGRLFEKGFLYRFPVFFLVLALYAIGLVTFLGELVYWFIPSHYEISATYAVMEIALFWFLVTDMRGLFSNKHLQPTGFAGG